MFEKFLPKIETSKVTTNNIDWNRRPLDINHQYLAVRESVHLIKLNEAISKTLESTTTTTTTTITTTTKNDKVCSNFLSIFFFIEINNFFSNEKVR